MDMLFRPVFRAKDPVMGSGPLPPPDRQSSFSTDDNNESEEGTNARVRPTTRVSSYIGIPMGFRPATPPIPAPETFPNYRNPESVYHKPSGDQLAEMLKVVMMNQGNMDPVPSQYNSTILHVLEAYQDLRMQLDAKEEAIEVLKQSYTKYIREFDELVGSWEQKENDYKAELKKLEVMLSRTEGGMESVFMARSNSVLHGAEKASDTINRGIGTVKAKNAARSNHDAGVDSPEFASVQRNIRTRRSFQILNERDSMTTASFDSPRRPPRKRATIDSLSRPRCPQFSESSAFQLYDSLEVRNQRGSLQNSDNHIQSLTKSQLEALERQQADECGVAFESSISGADSSSVSYHSEFPTAHNRQGLGIGSLDEKPLPEIPISAKARARQPTLDRFFHGRKHSYSDPNTTTERPASYQMGFSFQPGDDEVLLGRPTPRKTKDEHFKHHSSPLGHSEPWANPRSNVHESPQRIKGAPRHTIKTRPSVTGLSAKPSQLPRLQDHDQVSRMDSSSSSIITAVRDSSGRSSANNSQMAKPKLSRNTGSGSGSSEVVPTAATAAARAYGANKKPPTVSKKGSAAGSGSGAYETRKERNSSEANKSAIPTRNTSIASGNSSVSGSEVDNGHGKKVAGGARRNEKS